MNATTQPDLTAELYEALSDLVDRIERTVTPRVDRHGHGPWNAVVLDDLLRRVCSRCGQVESCVDHGRNRDPRYSWRRDLVGDGSCGSVPYKAVPR